MSKIKTKAVTKTAAKKKEVKAVKVAVKKQYLWKFLLEDDKGTIISDRNKYPWKIGKWETHEGRIEACAGGFHASERILDALKYVSGSVLARVEVKGHFDKEDDKQSWESMKIVKAYKWTKFDSVKFAIFSAKTVIEIYEKHYPGDARPRKAIEAAETYVKKPTEKNRAAADTAADAADAARAAADTAARAAYAAADAAARAAYAAADAAADAARAAADAAADAARAAALNKIEKFLLSHVSSLEEIK